MPLSRRRAVVTRRAVVIAVALLALVAQLGLSAMPAAAAITICNKLLRRSRSGAVSGRPAAGHRDDLSHASITIHYDDTDAMGWASIDERQPRPTRCGSTGRSTAAAHGRRAASSATPPSRPGNTGWRTAMFNVDDWNNLGVGALRACGKAGDRPEIACTAWARTTWNAGNRRTAAATALMVFYNNATGLFDTTGWWNSANALTAIIDNARVTGMGSYKYAIVEHLQQAAGRAGRQLHQRVPGRHRLVGARLDRRVRPDRRQPLPEHRPGRRRLHEPATGTASAAAASGGAPRRPPRTRSRTACTSSSTRRCTTGSPATPPTCSARTPSGPGSTAPA